MSVILFCSREARCQSGESARGFKTCHGGDSIGRLWKIQANEMSRRHPFRGDLNYGSRGRAIALRLGSCWWRRAFSQQTGPTATNLVQGSTGVPSLALCPLCVFPWDVSLPCLIEVISCGSQIWSSNHSRFCALWRTNYLLGRSREAYSSGCGERGHGANGAVEGIPEFQFGTKWRFDSLHVGEASNRSGPRFGFSWFEPLRGCTRPSRLTRRLSEPVLLSRLLCTENTSPVDPSAH